MSIYDKKIDPEEFFEYLLTAPENTKIYIGSDSERFRIKGQWFADYTTVACVHLAQKHGVHIFGQINRLPDYDQKKDRPIMRLMQECYEAAELFNTLKDAIEASGFEVAIHLDINSDIMAVSNIAVQQAIGYIQATCNNIIPFIKPDAWAGSFASDRWKEVQAFKTEPGFRKLSYKKKKRLMAA